MSRTFKDLPIELRTGLRERTEKGWMRARRLRGERPSGFALLPRDELLRAA